MMDAELTLYALPPLTAVERAAGRAVAGRLAPFWHAGVLAALDAHAATAAARLQGEWRPDVVLAAALAVRAPRQGHVGLDLGAQWPGAEPRGGESLRWPDPDVLRIELLDSPLIESQPGDESCDRPPRPFVFDGERLYTFRLWRLQADVAARLRRRLAAPPRVPADRALLRRGLAALFPAQDERWIDRQQLACALALVRDTTVISGGPGMGKTRTVLQLLILAYAQDAAARGVDPSRPPLQVALAAPTGKAAARMRESLLTGLTPEVLARCRGVLPPNMTVEALRAQLVGLSGITLHRLLGLRPEPLMVPRHGLGRPLPHNLVIVDETSMVDFELFARLTLALGADTRLVLLGDRHQLASVEAGTVLADLCGPPQVGASERLPAAPELVPATLEEVRRVLPEGALAAVDAPREAAEGHLDLTIQLTRTYRFSEASPIGTFVRACARGASTREIAETLAPTWLTPGRPPQLADVVRLALRNYAEALDLACAEVPLEPEGTFGERERRAHRLALDAFGRFRVLCAHRRGPLSVEAVNAGIEEALRRGPSPPGLRRRPQLDGLQWIGRPILITRNDTATRRHNGDVGLIVRRREADGSYKRVAAFAGPDPLLPDDGGARAPRLLDYLAPARLPPHETNFAMTIHKSQGSEFDIVLLTLPPDPSPLLTRELLYTGITRAARELHLAATPALVTEAIARPIRRASGLSHLLRAAPRLS